MRIPLATQSYRARSLPLSAQRLVNLYPERQPADAKSGLALFGTPGLEPFATAGGGPIRGLHVMRGVLYAVSGPAVFRVAADGTASLLGYVAGIGPVQMADNGAQILLVVPGQAGYVVTADAVVPVADPDFPLPTMVASIDGYHAVAETGSARIFISGLNAAHEWDALDFATAEAMPDDLVGLIADHRELWLFGETSTEVWYNSGGDLFPFERVSGAFIERGCIARHSIAKMDNSVFWLGDDRAVYRAAGYTPQRISTHPIEHAIEGFGRPDAATAFAYAQEGHHFYVLSFEEATFVYDAASELWHERESRDAAGNSLRRWRVGCGVYCYDRVLVGDYANGAIHALDLDVHDEAGLPLRREAISPPVHGEGRLMAMNRFEIEVESGVGMTAGQGADPQAMLQWSDDGGRTWLSEHWAPLGRIGEWRRRAVWRRLGPFRQRILKVAIADPVKVAIIAANADVK